MGDAFGRPERDFYGPTHLSSGVGFPSRFLNFLYVRGFEEANIMLYAILRISTNVDTCRTIRCFTNYVRNSMTNRALQQLNRLHMCNAVKQTAKGPYRIEIGCLYGYGHLKALFVHDFKLVDTSRYLYN